MTFKSLHQVLNTLEDQEAWQERQQFKRLLVHWPEVVGAVVSAQTQPIGIRKGVLQVATSSSVWAQNLLFERQRILIKLGDRISLKLSDIRFSTAHWHNLHSRLGEINAELVVWQDHPSRIAARPAHIAQHGQPIPRDAKLAFQQWATTVQDHSRQLPLCPRCQCPSPLGELKRWSVCSLCATSQWQHQITNNKD